MASLLLLLFCYRRRPPPPLPPHISPPRYSKSAAHALGFPHKQGGGGSFERNGAKYLREEEKQGHLESLEWAKETALLIMHTRRNFDKEYSSPPFQRPFTAIAFKINCESINHLPSGKLDTIQLRTKRTLFNEYSKHGCLSFTLNCTEREYSLNNLAISLRRIHSHILPLFLLPPRGGSDVQYVDILRKFFALFFLVLKGALRKDAMNGDVVLTCVNFCQPKRLSSNNPWVILVFLWAPFLGTALTSKEEKRAIHAASHGSRERKERERGFPE